jgi:hypothetical protein
MRGDILAAYILLYGVYSFKQGGGLRVLTVVSTALPSWVYFNRDVTDINSPSVYVLQRLACYDCELRYERLKVLGRASSLQSSNLVTWSRH